eukprot:39700-Pelagomonas_calceolata.AAC.1
MPFARASTASVAGQGFGGFLQVFGGSHVQGPVGIVQKLYGPDRNANFESAEGYVGYKWDMVAERA